MARGTVQHMSYRKSHGQVVVEVSDAQRQTGMDQGKIYVPHETAGDKAVIQEAAPR